MKFHQPRFNSRFENSGKSTSPKTIEETSGTANLKTQLNSAKCDYLIINKWKVWREKEEINRSTKKA
jgi:hypothetical protein